MNNSRNNLKVQPHKCRQRPSVNPKCRFCAYCGIYMSRSSENLKFYRSKKYNCIDPFRIDHEALIQELVKKQSMNRYYNSKACHIPYRHKMIMFIEEVSERLDYTESTFHLAVAILDALLALTSIETKMIKLISFMALYLAAKLHENNNKIPELSYIAKLFNTETTLQEIEAYEVKCAQILQYKLNLKTPYTFIEYFFSKGILSSKDLNFIAESTKEAKIRQFESLVTFFVRTGLENYEFYKYTSVAIATSAIACARKLMCFDDIWTPDLEALTRVSLKSISEVSEALFKAAEDSNPYLFKTTQNDFESEKIDQNGHFSKIRSESSITADYDSEKEGNGGVRSKIEGFSGLFDSGMKECYNRGDHDRKEFLFSSNCY